MSPTGRQNLQHGGQNQPGRRFSPPSRPVSPSGRHFAQSDRQNFHPGSKISLSGRRNSPPARQMAPTGRPVSPSGRRMSPSGRRFSPSGRRNSPPGRRISPGRQFSPSSRRISPHGQRISPSGRRMSPMGRKHSPSGRRITPERSFLPPGRRVSPGPGVIPSGRRISPSGRRMSPGNRTLPERRVSPGHRIAPMNKDDRHMQQRMSPGKPGMMRNMSPGRHSSPNRRPPSRSFDRYSPSRKPMDNIRTGPKEVRPAYASMTQAQSQPMYSGGYTPESRETEQYPPGHRKGDQRPNWQEREKPYQPPVKPVEDRRDLPGVPKYEARRGGDYPRPVLSQPESKATSPGRMSRSPNRRDRSPVRDRYRRHSPSPRSPRRSWALEKRRSPNDIEPPPPPSWPDRQENVYKSNRQHDEEDKKPVWIKIEARQKQEVKPTFFHKEDRRSYDRDDKKYFSNPSRSQWDSHHQPQLSDEFRDRSPLRPRSSDKYSPNQNESKSPREDFPINRRNEFQQQSPRYQEPRVEQFQNREKIKEDFDEFRHKRDDYHQSFNSREENLYLGQENLDKEIEDVYSRAAELTRKTDEYQRKRNSNIRFNVRQYSPEEVDFKNVKEESFKQDFYEASHSKFDKTPRQMGEVVSGDLAPAIQYKRDKAVDDLSRKVLMKFAQKFKGKLRHDVEEQLKILIEDMIFEMFGDKDVSFIEIVIKFEEKHGIKGMEKIFDKVISKFPIEIRLLKQQPAPDLSTSPVTISRSGSSLSMRDNELPAESNRAKVFKPRFREGPMRNPIAMKRTMSMYKWEAPKRPMYEPAVTKAPTKKVLPVKKNAPIKDVKKVLPNNDSGANIAGKPVLNKEINKKSTEAKLVEKESVNKAPEQSETEVSNIPSTSKEAEEAVVKVQKDNAEDKPSQEHQELSPLLSSALNSELEDIMIKVWQELPDEPLSLAEEHVIEKIRNEAGDDLRNLIGLNITKRLLDINSSLYAKLIFKMRPEKGALVDFIKKYNLKTFKRISDISPIFAAQFSNYEDYDRACNDGVVYCGDVRVNVKACYNFRTCPPNLKTSFSQHDKNTTNNDSGENSNIIVANKASKEIVLEKVQESDEIQDKSNEIQDKSNEIQNKSNEIQDESNEIQDKSNENNTSTNVSDITEATNDTENVTNVETKIETSAGIEVETEPTQDKEEHEIIDQVNEDEMNNLQTENSEVQDTQTNVNQQKDVEVNTGPTEDNEGNENVEVKNDEKTSKETVNEHLAIEDKDVLSIISEGIVLDECGSSDIE
ncbi:PREDICTED: uncharacterized protein LOC106108831 isoform X2 [Papilio polytes]|uniref:uncharacterized protein LOC106108831 isoform X2 n=1 Tax=Papilio polytes TaxID=76194 RepID=UPI00067611ED|nr:PREDICTED: uncharacterized protein LOC106108831 isoform X2 [Papilio polytes]